MGLYYVTYLCIGNFKNKIINMQVKIANINIVEYHEWSRGYIDFNELKIFISNNCEENLELLNKTEDLFLREDCTCTLSIPINITSKYIIIK